MNKLNQALNAESSLPVSAFTLGYAGLRVGFQLENNHPNCQGREALIVDEGFVPRDNVNGCLHQKGFVTHAGVNEFTTGAGKYMATLTTPKRGAVCALISTVLPATVKSRVAFRSGFLGNAHIVYESKKEALVEFKAGESFTIYFVDGTVREFACKGDTIVENPLTRFQMAQSRIAFCRLGLAQKYGGPREPREDAILHQLAQIYRFGDEEIRELVFKATCDMIEEFRITLRKSPAYALACQFRGNTIHWHGLNELVDGKLLMTA